MLNLAKAEGVAAPSAAAAPGPRYVYTSIGRKTTPFGVHSSIRVTVNRPFLFLALFILRFYLKYLLLSCLLYLCLMS